MGNEKNNKTGSDPAARRGESRSKGKVGVSRDKRGKKKKVDGSGGGGRTAGCRWWVGREKTTGI